MQGLFFLSDARFFFVRCKGWFFCQMQGLVFLSDAQGGFFCQMQGLVFLVRCKGWFFLSDARGVFLSDARGGFFCQMQGLGASLAAGDLAAPGLFFSQRQFHTGGNFSPQFIYLFTKSPGARRAFGTRSKTITRAYKITRADRRNRNCILEALDFSPRFIQFSWRQFFTQTRLRWCIGIIFFVS